MMMYSSPSTIMPGMMPYDFGDQMASSSFSSGMANMEMLDVSNSQPRTKKTAKKPAPTGMSFQRYNSTERLALVDAVAKINPSECKKKVKAEFDKSTGTTNRTEKALKKQYEKILNLEKWMISFTTSAVNWPHSSMHLVAANDSIVLPRVGSAEPTVPLSV